MQGNWDRLTYSMEEGIRVKNFLNRFRINIVDSNRRIQRYNPVPIMYGKWDHNPIDIPYESETLHTIQISDSDLTALYDFYNRVEESMKYTGSMDIFNHYIQREKDEKKFREQYPAVQKAYEQYRMLFKLAKSGDGNA